MTTIEYLNLTCNFSDIKNKINDDVEYEKWKNKFMLEFTSENIDRKYVDYHFDFLGLEMIIFLQDIFFDDNTITYAFTYKDEKIKFDSLEDLQYFLDHLKSALYTIAENHEIGINDIIHKISDSDLTVSIDNESLDANIEEITATRYAKLLKKFERAEKRAARKEKEREEEDAN